MIMNRLKTRDRMGNLYLLGAKIKRESLQEVIQKIKRSTNFVSDTLESDDITARLQPLIPSGAPSFIANVFDKVIPELQQSLDAEYKRSQSKLESEHKARLQSLHSQHHHQQFELYEKVIALQDQVQKLEDELNTRNKIIDNLSAIGKRVVIFILFRI